MGLKSGGVAWRPGDEVLAAYGKLMQAGFGDEDISAIYRLQPAGTDAPT